MSQQTPIDVAAAVSATAPRPSPYAIHIEDDNADRHEEPAITTALGYTQHLGAAYAPIQLRHNSAESFHEVWQHLNQVRVPAGFCRFLVDANDPISLATPQAKTAARMTLDAQLRNCGLANFQMTLNTQSNIFRSADIRLLPPVTDLERLTLRSTQFQFQSARLTFTLEGREIAHGCTFFSISEVSLATMEKPHQLLASLDGQFAHHGQRIESLWGVQELYQTADQKATTPHFNNFLCGISQAKKPDGIAQPPGWVSLPSSGRSCQVFYHDKPEWCVACAHTADAPHPTKDCRQRQQVRRRAFRNIRRLVDTANINFATEVPDWAQAAIAAAGPTLSLSQPSPGLANTNTTAANTTPLGVGTPLTAEGTTLIPAPGTINATTTPTGQQSMGPPAPPAAEDVEMMTESNGQQPRLPGLTTGAIAGSTGTTKASQRATAQPSDVESRSPTVGIQKRPASALSNTSSVEGHDPKRTHAAASTSSSSSTAAPAAATAAAATTAKATLPASSSLPSTPNTRSACPASTITKAAPPKGSQK